MMDINLDVYNWSLFIFKGVDLKVNLPITFLEYFFDNIHRNNVDIFNHTKNGKSRFWTAMIWLSIWSKLVLKN